ncbi:jacalin-related lectin 23-like [Ipomoea triloba]|uniref:jacalin-related lectin 23-like n=1 Tax=Ipomoea triloba TaxID=35885 RepID=UPI00125D43B2|nr:jacalin-related lectin 23-like [Ipomoea triloba]
MEWNWTDSVIGPTGYPRESFFSFRPNQKIDKIVISYGTPSNLIIVGLTFFSSNEDGSTDTLTIGGGGKDSVVIRKDTVLFDGANEYLTGISGRFSVFDDPTSPILYCIKFTTNLRETRMYGVELQSSPLFNLNAPDGDKIVGFLGRSGPYINALGVYHTKA